MLLMDDDALKCFEVPDSPLTTDNNLFRPRLRVIRSQSVILSSIINTCDRIRLQAV